MSKENNIVRVSSGDLRRGRTNWDAVKKLTDEEIEAAVASDPDAAPLLDEQWFQRAVLIRPGKTATSIRVDDDVMGWFRSQGKGWQTRMNAVLRTYAKAHGGVK